MDLATPYLDRFAKRIGTALSALNRRAGRNLSRLGKLISDNPRTSMLLAGLVILGIGVGLRLGVWAGLALPGAILTIVPIFGVSPTQSAKSPK